MLIEYAREELWNKKIDKVTTSFTYQIKEYINKILGKIK